MAWVRHFDRSEDIPSSVSAGFDVDLPNGQWCYIGAGRYAVASAARGVDLVEINSNDIGKIDLFVSYTGGNNGDGVAKGVEYNRAGKVIVSVQQNVGGALTQLLRQYDLGTATLDWETDVDACVSAGPICYNGIDWWLSYDSAVDPNSARFLLVEIDGSGVTIKRSLQHAQFVTKQGASDIRFTDICYDGHFLWALTGSFMSRWDISGRLAPRNAWYGTSDGTALPGTVHQGITTQRHSHVSVLART